MPTVYNKVVLDSTTIMDISDTTAVASDVASGKYFYGADGVKTLGTASAGPTTEIVVPEQTITVSQAYTEIPTYTEDLVAGETYIYTVNGVSATATAESLYGSPAVIIVETDVTFDQTDTKLYFSVTDSSKYGEYTIKVEKVSSSSGGVSTVTIFPSQSVTADVADTSGYYIYLDDITEQLTDDTNYIVTLDDVAYPCHANNVYSGSDVYAGDTEVVWGTPANAIYPFALGSYGNGKTSWMVADNSPHTVKIERIVSLDTSTLGTKTITTNGTYEASSDGFNGYSSVTVDINLPVSWETKSDQGITIVADNPNYFIWTYNEALNADETFRITWGENGTQYVCQTVVDLTSTTYDGYYLGNAHLADSSYSDTGEPFFIYRDRATRMVGITERSAGAWHIKVEKQVAASAPTLQSKTVGPTTSQQTITPDSGYDGLSSVTVNAIPSQYIVPSGTLAVSSNGTHDVTNYASVSVDVPTSSGMNVQAYMGYDAVNASSYTATDVTLTVAKTGTYTVSWMGYRNTNSGTSGSQLYVNGTARGSAQTTFVNTYGQSVVLTNQSLNEGDVLVVRARSRNTSYYMGVGNLIIEQTA